MLDPSPDILDSVNSWVHLEKAKNVPLADGSDYVRSGEGLDEGRLAVLGKFRQKAALSSPPELMSNLVFRH